MMPSLASKPSISTSSWFRVCSRSSLPPPRPAPRWRPTASISSMKMMQGAFFLACSNMSRTRLAPTPTNISTKSEPEMEKNGTPASPATARPSRVLPVPGGPTSSAPLGILPPRRWNLAGSFRKSTISVSSSLASSTPATSSKVTRFLFSVSSRALDLPKPMAPRAPPCIWRMKKHPDADQQQDRQQRLQQAHQQIGLQLLGLDLGAGLLRLGDQLARRVLRDHGRVGRAGLVLGGDFVALDRDQPDLMLVHLAREAANR